LVLFFFLETSIIKGFRAALVFDLGVVFRRYCLYRNSLFRSYRLIQSLKDQPALLFFGGVLMVAYGIISFIQLKKRRKINTDIIDRK
jgi:hypothetical protein